MHTAMHPLKRMLWDRQMKLKANENSKIDFSILGENIFRF